MSKLHHPPARVLQTRPADDNHVVLTVSDGQRRYRRQPCGTCPWRRDAVGEFPAEAFRHSAPTGYDGSACTTPALLAEAVHGFACHQSGKEKPALCAGYILASQDAIGWRINAHAGNFDARKVSDGGHALFTSYREMALANGVPENDPSIAACRARGEDFKAFQDRVRRLQGNARTTSDHLKAARREPDHTRTQPRHRTVPDHRDRT